VHRKAREKKGGTVRSVQGSSTLREGNEKGGGTPAAWGATEQERRKQKAAAVLGVLGSAFGGGNARTEKKKKRGGFLSRSARPEQNPVNNTWITSANTAV